MVPFERSLSKLSENNKIVEIGPTEFKLWRLKESSNRDYTQYTYHDQRYAYTVHLHFLL